MRISNQYAPEHLILQLKDAEKVVEKVMNAGSVFIGEWTPESVGDYSAGVNHSLRKYLRSCKAGKVLTRVPSDIWLCQAVLRCQSWLLRQAHHELQSYSTGATECRRRGDAASEGRGTRGSQESRQYPDRLYGQIDGQYVLIVIQIQKFYDFCALISRASTYAAAPEPAIQSIEFESTGSPISLPAS